MPEPLDVIASPLTDFGACTHWSADEWNVHDLLLLIKITPELTDPRNTKQVDQHPSGCLGRCCRVCIASAYQDTQAEKLITCSVFGANRDNFACLSG